MIPDCFNLNDFHNKSRNLDDCINKDNNKSLNLPYYKLIINIFACPTIDKYKKEILKINSTWGVRAKEKGVKLLFMFGEENTDLIDDKYVYLKNVKNDYESASHKQNLGLKYIYDNYNVDYVLTCGTDTYINIDKLLIFLDTLNVDDKLYVGGHGDIRRIGNDNLYFHSGGPGFIITKSVLNKLYPLLENMFSNWKDTCSNNNVHYLINGCDVAIAYYISKITDIKIIKNNLSFFNCNYEGQANNNTCNCCANHIDIINIITCHCMTLDNFDKYTQLLELNNYYI